MGLVLAEATLLQEIILFLKEKASNHSPALNKAEIPSLDLHQAAAPICQAKQGWLEGPGYGRAAGIYSLWVKKTFLCTPFQNTDSVLL